MSISIPINAPYGVLAATDMSTNASGPYGDPHIYSLGAASTLNPATTPLYDAAQIIMEEAGVERSVYNRDLIASAMHEGPAAVRSLLSSLARRDMKDREIIPDDIGTRGGYFLIKRQLIDDDYGLVRLVLSTVLVTSCNYDAGTDSYMYIAQSALFDATRTGEEFPRYQCFLRNGQVWWERAC